LGDYENEKSYLGLMIVYPEQLKGGLNSLFYNNLIYLL